MAAIIGAAAFLTGQAYNILGRGKSASAWQTMVVAGAAIRGSTRFPGRTFTTGRCAPCWASPAEPLLAVIACDGRLGIFLLANQISWAPRFAADAAAAAGVGTGGTRKARAGTRARFSTSVFAATFAKELRLIGRDPALISQVLLRVLYILPLGFVLLRQAGAAQGYALPGSAGALSMIAGQITGSLAWITISAEDAPDLLSCSPAPIRTLRRAKLAAAILCRWRDPAAATFLAIPLTFTWRRSRRWRPALGCRGRRWG